MGNDYDGISLSMIILNKYAVRILKNPMITILLVMIGFSQRWYPL